MKKTNTKHKSSEDFLSLADLWMVCRANWRWYVVSLMVFVLTAGYVLGTQPDIFTSEAAVLVRQEQQGKNAGRNATGGDFSDIGLVQQTTNVENVCRELSSLKVLSEVARRFHPGMTLKERIKKAESLRACLKTSMDNERSTIINLSFKDLSIEHANQVLDTIISVYNDLSLEDKNQITANASRFISDRLAIVERELGNVDDSIASFKTLHHITDLDRVSDLYLSQQSQSEADILRLSNQRAMAVFILDLLRDKGSEYQLLPTNSGINNVVAEAQIKEHNDRVLLLRNSLQSTTKRNPLIRRMEGEIAELRRNILTTIENQVKTLDIQLQALTGYSDEAGSKIASNPGQMMYLTSIEREQKVMESLYLYLLQKKEENEISMTYNSQATQIIDMPHGSDKPTGPNRKALLAAAILAGLFVPTLAFFIRENLNDTVRDKFDIEHHSSLPLIGEVPLCALSSGRRRLWQRLFKSRPNVAPNPFVVVEGKQDVVNEAFRYIRTNVEFMTGRQGENNVYVITSNYTGSGKTFVCLNLALSITIKGSRVLCIDGDLRHASVSHAFGCTGPGIADYLGRQADDVEPLLVYPEGYSSLAVLPVGTIPPNPTELLSGDRMKILLDHLRPLFDVILIDCPPVEILADTDIINVHADRTLFVVRAGLFQRNHIGDLENDVQDGRYKHLSVILNATRMSGRYGRRYGYHYANHYRSVH